MILINAPRAKESATTDSTQSVAAVPSLPTESFRSDLEAEALFREAKRRERMRRLGVAAVVMVLLGGGLYFGLSGGGSHGTATTSGAPRWSSAAAGRASISSATITMVNEKVNSRGQIMSGGSELISATFGSGGLQFQRTECPFPRAVPGTVAPAEPECAALPATVTIVQGGKVTSYRSVTRGSAICTSVCVRASRDWYVMPIENPSAKSAANVRALVNHYSPAAALSALRQAAKRPFIRVRGPVVIAGVPTTEFEVQFKPAASPRVVRQADYAALVWSFIQGEPVYVWLDRQGQLRQLESRGPLQGAIGHEWRNVETTTFSNFNATAVSQLPPNDVLSIGKFRGQIDVCAPPVAVVASCRS